LRLTRKTRPDVPARLKKDYNSENANANRHKGIVTKMYTSIYSDDALPFIEPLVNTAEMKRLSDVGMHCGVEYAGFQVYQQQNIPYSRLMHCVGVSKIVWNFTHDIRQAISGLLHDIATPVFAHTIDFLHGDHMRQESTEDNTLPLINNSREITRLLKNFHISVEEVADYHMYPIADNDTPMLSADRLEYTIGNGFCLYGMNLSFLNSIYTDLIVVQNEKTIDELCFQSIHMAKQFAEISLRNSYLFVSDEDRFAMQCLADLLQYAIKTDVLTSDDLYLTETQVIRKLNDDRALSRMWERYTKISSVAATMEKRENRYYINVSAKKRFIDPLVLVEGHVRRLSDIDDGVKEWMEAFLDLDFNKWIYAI
jgi:HD superfamily phosphohydrolase